VVQISSCLRFSYFIQFRCIQPAARTPHEFRPSFVSDPRRSRNTNMTPHQYKGQRLLCDRANFASIVTALNNIYRVNIVGLRSLVWCDFWFESRRGHWCLSIVCVAYHSTGRSLCVGFITCPGESYRVWCVWVWSWSLYKHKDLAHWGVSRQWRRRTDIIDSECFIWNNRLFIRN